MIPNDPVYVDHPRLDHYFEQITSSAKQRKPFAWAVKLGLSPSVEIKPEQSARPAPTTTEKIRVLLEGLAAERALHHGRVLTYKRRLEEDEVFRLETTTVVHAFIPPITAEALALSRYGKAAQVQPGDEEDWLPVGGRTDFEAERARRGRLAARESMLEEARREIADFKGLHLWLSHPWYDPHAASSEYTYPQLLLVGDSRRSDQEIAPGGSAYSALVGLFDEVGELAVSVLASVKEARYNPTSGFHVRFLADPCEALKSVGVRFGEPKPVRTLYYVRRVIGYRAPSGHEAATTIAYPIFIEASGA